MSTFTITAEDTLTLGNRVFNDFADDDVSKITFPNDMVKAKTGKNKNTIFSRDATGDNAVLALRLIRGSSDDQFLQSIISGMEVDFVATITLDGEFVKRLGDGQGNIKRDVYTLQGGMIQKKPESGENVAGGTDQAVAMYTIIFANGKRSIQ